LIYSVQGHDLYLANAFIPRNEYENICALLGLTENYASAATSIADGGTLTCNELVLQLYSRDQPQALQDQQNNFYMDPKIPTSLSFLSVQRMPYPITLAASTKYDVVLTGIRGIASYTYDLVDGSGNSLLGSTQKNNQDQLMEYATCFDNKFRKLINFNFIPFSSDPTSDYTLGTGTGYQCFSGFERLQFWTPSGLSPGSYLLDIIAFVQDDLVIRSGIAKSTGMN